MAAPKRATHVVVHPKLCLAVEGKVQRVPKGTQLTIDKENLSQYKNLIATGKIKDLSEVKTIAMSGDPGSDKDQG